MKKEEAMKLSENAISELSEALAKGKSELLVKYLDTMSSFHNYSFGNCLLIARQCPEATMVAGFHAWKKLKRQVKKGEKGICILAPMVGKREETDDEEGSKVFGFRAVHVFDVAQTEGEELPKPSRVSGDPGEKLAKLHGVASSLEIVVTHEQDLGGAEGVSKGGHICLREGLSPAEEFNTLAHELAHELLHQGKDRSQWTKEVRELEAESVAYVVSVSAGLENALSQSADYIQSYSGDKEQLTKSLERVQKTASRILTELEKSDSDSSSKALQEVA